MCDCVSGAGTERAEDEDETADAGDGDGSGAAAETDAGESPVRDTGGISQRGAAGGQQTVCETTEGKKARSFTGPNSTDRILLLAVSRSTVLQKEREQQREQHEQTLQKLLAKHEMDMSHLHQEHALSAAKVHTNLSHKNQQIELPSTSFSKRSLLQASEVMKDCENVVAQLKQQLLESEHQRQHQVKV